MALSDDDVQRLLSDKTSGTREDMTHRIAGAYGATALDPRESIAAEQIFRLLMRDTEVRVRASLAEHIKNSAVIPRDIVLKLAHDVEEVSLPVLQHSEVLTDGDLVELIQSTQEVSRYLAISKRASVSPAVTDTLIEKGNEEVAKTLVENKGAQLSEAGVDRIVTAHHGNESLMKTLSDRPQLPLAAVDKIMHAVSGKLAESLKEKYKLPAAQIDKEVEKTREKETLGLIRLAASDKDIEHLVGQLQAGGRLTPAILLSALCQGNFQFFEKGLSALSHVPLPNVHKLVTDKGDLGFRALYNKCGLPDAMFPGVKLLLSIVRELVGGGEKPGSALFANKVVERILKQSEGSHIENLSYIIAMVRKSGQ